MDGAKGFKSGGNHSPQAQSYDNCAPLEEPRRILALSLLRMVEMDYTDAEGSNYIRHIPQTELDSYSK